MPLFCELDRSAVDHDRAAIFAAEFLVWWEQAGRVYYSRRAGQSDEGLRGFADEAVRILGGWKAARRTIKSAW